MELQRRSSDETHRLNVLIKKSLLSLNYLLYLIQFLRFSFKKEKHIYIYHYLNLGKHVLKLCWKINNVEMFPKKNHFRVIYQMTSLFIELKLVHSLKDVRKIRRNLRWSRKEQLFIRITLTKHVFCSNFSRI